MGEPLHLFHTAAVHIPRFDALRDRLAPGQKLIHHLREDWLARARAGGITGELRAEVQREISGAGATCLCTCTTLGEIAAAAGATRIDLPVMHAAAEIGGRICLAYCLESPAEASTALLEDCIAAAGKAGRVDPLPLAEAWPIFEAGDDAGFAATVAAGIRAHVMAQSGAAAVVLAQASMDGAAGLLADLGIPVMASPERAMRYVLGLGG